MLNNLLFQSNLTFIFKDIKDMLSLLIHTYSCDSSNGFCYFFYYLINNAKKNKIHI
jgi:hypothetical protein